MAGDFILKSTSKEHDPPRALRSTLPSSPLLSWCSQTPALRIFAHAALRAELGEAVAPLYRGDRLREAVTSPSHLARAGAGTPGSCTCPGREERGSQGTGPGGAAHFPTGRFL